MKHFIFFLVFTYGLSLSAQGFVYSNNFKPAQDFLVVEGELSTKASLHVNHVVMFTGAGSSCSGTIISDNAILTAAHCETSFNKIHFGLSKKTKKVSTYIIHEDYREEDKLTPDVAIVYFEGGLPKGFEPMKMATKMDLVKSGHEVFVAGFGLDKSKKSGKLKHFVTTADNAYAKYGILVIDNNETGFACYGDSGGTTYIVENGEAVLVGINNNIGPKFEGVFCKTEFMFTAYVPFYIDWINKHLKN